MAYRSLIHRLRRQVTQQPQFSPVRLDCQTSHDRRSCREVTAEHPGIGLIKGRMIITIFQSYGGLYDAF